MNFIDELMEKMGDSSLTDNMIKMRSFLDQIEKGGEIYAIEISAFKTMVFKKLITIDDDLKLSLTPQGINIKNRCSALIPRLDDPNDEVGREIVKMIKISYDLEYRTFKDKNDNKNG